MSKTASKIAVITGGSRGIGKSIALQAGQRGVGIILTYNSHPEEGQAVAAEINKNGGKAIALKFDAGNIGGIKEFAAQVSQGLKEQWDRDKFDYLVNNAGTAGRAMIKDVTEELFDRIVTVNFKSVFFLSQQLIPMMIDGGQIINISSALARFALPGFSIYGALKSGLEGLTRYFAKEYSSQRIRVNSIAPGPVDTEFGGGKGNATQRQQAAALSTMGRMW